MVQVRTQHPLNADGSIDLERWVAHLQEIDDSLDAACLLRACEFARDAELQAHAAKNLWPDGSSSLQIGLETAQILVDLMLDEETLQAAILYRSVRENKASLTQIEEEFGATVAKLIDGVLRMAAISASLNPRESVVLNAQAQVENLRKMLVAMVDDVRVALIKLAERTCAIRAVKNAPDERRYRVAREVFDIYAPLAHRLGIGHIKWELEDLSFRYLEPEQYMHIAGLLHEKRLDRQRFIDDVVQQLNSEMQDAGIEAEISGRVKHI